MLSNVLARQYTISNGFPLDWKYSPKWPLLMLSVNEYNIS